ncbi:MAG: hypothetical protein IKQ68_01725 [Prevotella sp.]|nr:hypothetical protein [Prevotella sp.]
MKKTLFTLVCLMIMGTVTSNAKTTVIIASHTPNSEFVIKHETNAKKDAKIAKRNHKMAEKHRKEMEKRHKKLHKEHAKLHKHHHHHHHHPHP